MPHTGAASIAGTLLVSLLLVVIAAPEGKIASDQPPTKASRKAPPSMTRAERGITVAGR